MQSQLHAEIDLEGMLESGQKTQDREQIRMHESIMKLIDIFDQRLFVLLFLRKRTLMWGKRGIRRESVLLLVVIARSGVAGSSSVQRQPFLVSRTSDQSHSLRQTLALSLRGGGAMDDAPAQQNDAANDAGPTKEAEGNSQKVYAEES